MKKLHLTRFAAVATVALMGSTAAWADDTGWSVEGSTLTLQSIADPGSVSISSDDASSINTAEINTIVVNRGTLGTTQYSTIMLPVEVSVGECDQIDKAYTVGKINYYSSVPELTMNEVTTLNANKPYIIKFKDNSYGLSTNITFSKTFGTFVVQSTAVSGEKPYTTEVSGSCFSITGTYVTKRWDSGDNLSNDYGFSADGSDIGKFVRIQNNPISSESVTLLPARAYLTCTKAQAVKGLGKVASEESLPDVINVRFVDNEGGTLSIGTMNTRTGEIQMQDRYYDLKGRKLNAKPQNKIMYVNKKVIKH